MNMQLYKPRYNLFTQIAKTRGRQRVKVSFVRVNTYYDVTNIGYEPADLTVYHPPELPWVGSFFSYRCLVFPEKCPQRKA